jgi:hypothetical protein
MKVILAEGDEAEKFFEQLINRVGDRVILKIQGLRTEQKSEVRNEDEQWIDNEAAKKILGIRSKKKMQSLRDQNLIRFSQHGRTIRYYKPSLFSFLEKNVVR